MTLIISKFGGTSVSSRKNWENILYIANRHISNQIKPIIVCSAITQASNMLEQLVKEALIDKHHELCQTLITNYNRLADELEVDVDLIKNDFLLLEKWLTGVALLKQAPSQTKAQISSLGELMVTKLGHAFLNQNGMNCLWFDAREAIIAIPDMVGEITNYCASKCSSDYSQDLSEKFTKCQESAIITQGFIGSTPNGETVLLGRGGSDTSAALFASIVKASACEIWTDVPGIYTANPHQMPHARLLKKLNYDEAQEIASMGAKVIHPLCIPPVRKANIPMLVKCTMMPDHSGTSIYRESDDEAPPIKSVLVKHSITLISIDTMNMWQKIGFLADVFAAFKKYGYSVDLIATSESNITLSLDNNDLLPNRNNLEYLLAELNVFCKARIIEPCSAVSLVGHDIRRVLPQLGSTLELFDNKQVHLMSLASNDLNLTFVVDESQSQKLCQDLHALLIENNPQSFYYSKSWHDEFGDPVQRLMPWWEAKRDILIDIAQKNSPCYVYDKQTQDNKIKELKSIKAIDTIFYAMKANSNHNILHNLNNHGLGFECVSKEELELILKLFPNIDRKKVLFTPNFAPKEEYEFAINTGCHLTIDSLYPLENWPNVLTGKDIILRIDPGCGSGHHKFVCTGGNESKFGISLPDIQKAQELIKKHKINVVGLHSHAGSGILSPDLWKDTALMLLKLAENFPNTKYINLGGGLGVAEKPGQQCINLELLDKSLTIVKNNYPQYHFWLEPGRYFVSESGVIVAKVTQCKEKGKVRFIGIETGMNSLIRPALYGAYHNIVNLSSIDQQNHEFAHIVGPICESGDTLGYNRMLPKTFENDIILIANAGAYGYCMSSSYNLRSPAQEIFLE